MPNVTEFIQGLDGKMTFEMSDGSVQVKDPLNIPSSSSTSGSAFVPNQATGLAEVDVDGDKYVALPTNSSGQAIGEIGHRRGLLADLITLAGTPGEISIPTDYRGVIVHTGSPDTAYYVGDESYSIDTEVTPCSPEGQLIVPRGFAKITIAGDVPLAAYTNAGGVQIVWGGDGSTGPAGQCSVNVLAPFQTLGLVVQLFTASIIDFTGIQAGKTYFAYDLSSAGIGNPRLTPVLMA